MILEAIARRKAVYFCGDDRESSLQRVALAREIARTVPGFDAVSYPDWSSLLDRWWSAAPAATTLVIDELPALVSSAGEIPSLLQHHVDRSGSHIRYGRLPLAWHCGIRYHFNMGSNMKTISIAVNKDVYEELQRSAREQGRSVAQLMREAMVLYLEERLAPLPRLEEVPVLVGHRLIGALPTRAETYDEIFHRQMDVISTAAQVASDEPHGGEGR